MGLVDPESGTSFSLPTGLR